jgi:hypothetical protein
MAPLGVRHLNDYYTTAKQLSRFLEFGFIAPQYTMHESAGRRDFLCGVRRAISQSRRLLFK